MLNKMLDLRKIKMSFVVYIFLPPLLAISLTIYSMLEEENITTNIIEKTEKMIANHSNLTIEPYKNIKIKSVSLVDNKSITLSYIKYPHEDYRFTYDYLKKITIKNNLKKVIINGKTFNGDTVISPMILNDLEKINMENSITLIY